MKQPWGWVALGVVGLLIYRQAKADAKALGQAVNPADSNNVINTWFNGAYQSVTGSQDTLGQDVYDILH